MSPAAGRTIREAIVLALESVPYRSPEFMTDEGVRAIRHHIRDSIHTYALARGVQLSDSDIDSELAALAGWLVPTEGR